MIVWKSKYIREGEIADEIIFKRHGCQWILPQALAAHLRYNPRHLPVVPAPAGLSSCSKVASSSIPVLVDCIVQHAARS
jgi:hypothetical protein